MVIVPILQLKKLRAREEVKGLAQSQIVSVKDQDSTINDLECFVLLCCVVLWVLFVRFCFLGGGLCSSGWP